MLSRDQLSEFAAWCHSHIIGGEKGEAQIFLDHLFQVFGYVGGLKEAGATLEMRVSRAGADGIAPRCVVELSRRRAAGDDRLPPIAGVRRLTALHSDWREWNLVGAFFGGNVLAGARWLRQTCSAAS